ncbi:hypothetical protein [Faecalimicrobium sp. JNUCC 81]
MFKVLNFIKSKWEDKVLKNIFASKGVYESLIYINILINLVY